MSAAALKLASFSANACAAPSRRSRPQHLPLAPRDPVWPVPVSRRTRAGGDLYQRLARLQCVAASSCFGLATPTPQPIGSRLAPPIAFPWLPWRACASGTAWGTRPCALNGIEADVIGLTHLPRCSAVHPHADFMSRSRPDLFLFGGRLACRTSGQSFFYKPFLQLTVFFLVAVCCAARTAFTRLSFS